MAAPTHARCLHPLQHTRRLYPHTSHSPPPHPPNQHQAPPQPRRSLVKHLEILMLGLHAPLPEPRHLDPSPLADTRLEHGFQGDAETAHDRDDHGAVLQVRVPVRHRLPVEEVHEQDQETGGEQAYGAAEVLHMPLAEGGADGALELLGRGDGEVEGGG
ncbi:hypothetical protein F5B19DRAFT_498627 [Rostrohypoxylon terebratum]|nr:hypothetical protein F5B19DRAFT_498627 [Rostrohypoxylon terebratum]